MTRRHAIKIQWITEESDAAGIRRSLVAEDTAASARPWEPDADILEEFGDSQLEPMTMVVGTVAAGWLIKRVSDVLLDWKRPGGMLIDTTKEELLVRPAPLARRGDLIFVTAQGPFVHSREERDTALRTLANLLASPSG